MERIVLIIGLLFFALVFILGFITPVGVIISIIFNLLRNKYKESKTKFLRNTALTVGVVGILIYAYNLHKQQNPKLAETESDYRYNTSSYSSQILYESSSEDNESLESVEQDPIDSDNFDVQSVLLSKEELSKVYEKCFVTRVLSGDTIRVSNGSVEKDIKLIGLKNPEDKDRVEEAKEYIGEKTKGKAIYLQKDKVDADSKGRLFRYVWLVRPTDVKPPVYDIETKLLNSHLLYYGFVDIYLGEKNTEYNDVFETIVYDSDDMVKNLVHEYENSVSDQETSSEEKVINPSINQSYVADTTQGVVKGNRRSKIYHMPYQQDYNNISVKNVVYFETEEDAINAGYRKAMR